MFHELQAVALWLLCPSPPCGHLRPFSAGSAPSPGLAFLLLRTGWTSGIAGPAPMKCEGETPPVVALRLGRSVLPHLPHVLPGPALVLPPGRGQPSIAGPCGSSPGSCWRVKLLLSLLVRIIKSTLMKVMTIMAITSNVHSYVMSSGLSGLHVLLHFVLRHLYEMVSVVGTLFPVGKLRPRK